MIASGICNLRRSPYIAFNDVVTGNQDVCTLYDVGSIVFPNPRVAYLDSDLESDCATRPVSGSTEEETAQGYKDSPELDLSCAVTSVLLILQAQELHLEQEDDAFDGGWVALDMFDCEASVRKYTAWLEWSASKLREFPVRCKQLSDYLLEVADLAVEGDNCARLVKSSIHLDRDALFFDQVVDLATQAHLDHKFEADVRRPVETRVFQRAIKASVRSHVQRGLKQPAKRAKTILLSDKNLARKKLRMLLQSLHREPNVAGNVAGTDLADHAEVGNISFMQNGRRVQCPLFDKHLWASFGAGFPPTAAEISEFLNNSTINQFDIDKFPETCRALAALFLEIAHVGLQAGLV